MCNSYWAYPGKLRKPLKKTGNKDILRRNGRQNKVISRLLNIGHKHHRGWITEIILQMRIPLNTLQLEDRYHKNKLCNSLELCKLY